MTALAATVGGAPVSVDDVDIREARLRAGPRAAALPAAGTGEGRTLVWLAPGYEHPGDPHQPDPPPQAGGTPTHRH